MTPALYVKNKMAEPRFYPKEKWKKFFLGLCRAFLLDFLFQDIAILSRICLKKNCSLKLSQKASELNSFFYLVCNLSIYWASEASPTQGCSIKISRDICIYIMYICRYVSYVKLTA